MACCEDCVRKTYKRLFLFLKQLFRGEPYVLMVYQLCFIYPCVLEDFPQHGRGGIKKTMALALAAVFLATSVRTAVQAPGWVHCLAKCPPAPIADTRVVCTKSHATECDTITHGLGVPSSEWLDTIVRKSQNPCTPWYNSEANLTGMTTCVRRKSKKEPYF